MKVFKLYNFTGIIAWIGGLAGLLALYVLISMYIFYEPPMNLDPYSFASLVTIGSAISLWVSAHCFMVPVVKIETSTLNSSIRLLEIFPLWFRKSTLQKNEYTITDVTCMSPNDEPQFEVYLNFNNREVCIICSKNENAAKQKRAELFANLAH